MLSGVFRFAVLSVAVVCACDSAVPSERNPAEWTVARSDHFEVYSEAGAQSARAALIWFEQLRTFFEEQSGIKLVNLAPVRVIGFDSEKGYEPFRTHPTADAFYVGAPSRDYIVMPHLDASRFAVAAHEYAHLAFHAAGTQLPAWLGEGLAEFYSTVHITPRQTAVGGDLPPRSQLLRREKWMPLSELLVCGLDSVRDRPAVAMFYSQGWALSEMLMRSPGYAGRFALLLDAVRSGMPSAEALTRTYGRPLETIERDLRAWVAAGPPKPVITATIGTGVFPCRISVASNTALRLVLGELLIANERWDQAEALYRDLARVAPESPDVAAGLGAILLQKGDTDEARQNWRRAIGGGVNDPMLCYRYAILAEAAGLPVADIRPAFERALELRPVFDDARYQLALLESNAGNYESALRQLRAMGHVAPERAYGYWTTMSNALNELGDRERAKDAAERARAYASTADERRHAAELSWFSQTDLAVRMTRDAEGHTQLVTTRVSHYRPHPNPFIEPGDDIQQVNATLREFDCSSKPLRVKLDTPTGPLSLAVPDPSHVQITNGRGEFTCGPQETRTPVTVEYATDAAKSAPGDNGVLRGIEFH
jgi:tetratricopeptide (TPR) repeat protein